MGREKSTDEDSVSFCGSFSGETFSSTRRRKVPLPVKAPVRLANKLKSDALTVFEAHKGLNVTNRWNTSFHHLRCVVCVMAGFSFGAMIYLRYIITVAILRMVDQSALFVTENSTNPTIHINVSDNYDNPTLSTPANVETINDNDYFGPEGEFVWDNEIQQMIMSWYMFAYTIPQVPCTKLATLIGARLAIPIFLSACIIASALTPVLAFFGWQWVVFLRLVNGLGASAILPMMLMTIEEWMPRDEISLGLTYAQVIQASLISLQPLISGYLCSIHWSWAFYVPSGVAVCFIILWLIVITDKPERNKFISEKELSYILDGDQNIHLSRSAPATQTSKPLPISPLPQNATSQCASIEAQTTTTKLPEIYMEVNSDKSGNFKQQLEEQHQFNEHISIENSKGNSKEQGLINNINLNQNTNCKCEIIEVIEGPAQAGLIDILRVPVFYAYLVMWSVYCGSYSVFNFVMPTYLQQFLKIGISHNGFYCALIQTGCILSCLWPHPCLYILQSRFKFSLTVARRITHCFLCSMVALSWAYVGLEHNNQLVFFFISRCFHASNDIVATGTIMTNFSKGGVTALAFSMINTVGNLSVVMFSGATGYVLDHTNQSVSGWTLIFMLGSGCQILMMTLYSTVVRSEPIDFPGMKKKQREREQKRKREQLEREREEPKQAHIQQVQMEVSQ